jgi:hypothetical protein
VCVCLFQSIWIIVYVNKTFPLECVLATNIDTFIRICVHTYNYLYLCCTWPIWITIFIDTQIALCLAFRRSLLRLVPSPVGLPLRVYHSSLLSDIKRCPSSCCMFPDLDLKSTIYSWIPGSFWGQWYLKAAVRVL